jgi:hypothetical protein
LRYLVYTDLGGDQDLTQTKQLQMLIGKCKLLEGAKLNCKMKAKDQDYFTQLHSQWEVQMMGRVTSLLSKKLWEVTSYVPKNMGSYFTSNVNLKILITLLCHVMMMNIKTNVCMKKYLNPHVAFISALCCFSWLTCVVLFRVSTTTSAMTFTCRSTHIR